MRTEKFLAAVAVATLMSAPAFAQTTPPPATSPAPAAPMTAPAPAATPSASVPAIPAQQIGQYLGSKMPGVDVYNTANEKIGDIADLVVDKDGKISAVIISVGGFLGMGKHDVAIPFGEIKFMDEAPATTTSARRDPATTGTVANAPAAPTTAPAPASVEPRAYPHHIVVNMTAEQLKAAPAYKYGG